MKKKRLFIILAAGIIAAISAVLVLHQLELKQLKGILFYTAIDEEGKSVRAYEHSFDSQIKSPVALEGYSRIYCITSMENGFVCAAVARDNEQHIVVVNQNDGKQSSVSIDVPSDDLNSPVSALAPLENEIIYQLRDGAVYKLDYSTGKASFLMNGKVRGAALAIGGGVLLEQTIDGANWISMYQNGTVEAICPGAMPLVLSSETFLFYSEEAQAVMEYRLKDKTSALSELAYVPERYTSFDEFRTPVVKDGWVIGCEKTFRYDTPIPGAKFKLVVRHLETGRRITVPGFGGERIYNLAWTDR